MLKMVASEPELISSSILLLFGSVATTNVLTKAKFSLPDIKQPCHLFALCNFINFMKQWYPFKVHYKRLVVWLKLPNLAKHTIHCHLISNWLKRFNNHFITTWYTCALIRIIIICMHIYHTTLQYNSILLVCPVIYLLQDTHPKLGWTYSITLPSLMSLGSPTEKWTLYHHYSQNRHSL